MFLKTAVSLSIILASFCLTSCTNVGESNLFYVDENGQLKPPFYEEENRLISSSSESTKNKSILAEYIYQLEKEIKTIESKSTSKSKGGGDNNGDTGNKILKLNKEISYLKSKLEIYTQLGKNGLDDQRNALKKEIENYIDSFEKDFDNIQPDAISKNNLNLKLFKTLSPEDTYFSIFFNLANLKHIADIGDVNEVVVLFELEETDTKNKYTQIIGPAQGIIDNTYYPILGGEIYGPKKLEGPIRLKITIIEMDQDENQQLKSVLNVISNITNSTGGPIQGKTLELVSTVAETLIELNSDDIVLQKTLNFNSGSSGGLPLKKGKYVLIKREITTEYQKPFSLTRNLNNKMENDSNWFFPLYLFSVPIDLVTLIPTSGYYLFSDTIGENSKQNFNRKFDKKVGKENDTDIYADDNGKLFFHNDSRRIYREDGDKLKEYKRKTYLVFEVENNVNKDRALDWERKAKLNDVQSELDKIITSSSLDSTKIEKIVQLLNKIKTKPIVNKASEKKTTE